MKQTKIVLTLLALFLSTALMPTMAQTRKRTTTARKTTTPAKKTTTAVATKPNLVDLGLPSGTLWADRNIGATSITNMGGYYAYGEVETKSLYRQGNYTGPGCVSFSGGDERYDVAAKMYGKGWRIPRLEDYNELKSNCQVECVMLGTTVALKFTGPNGASIIFPFHKDHVASIYNDYATSKHEIWKEAAQELNQELAAAKRKAPNKKIGIGMAFMSTSDCYLALMLGGYGIDVDTGKYTGRSSYNFDSITRCEYLYWVCGYPVRAIFQAEKKDSVNDRPSSSEGESEKDTLHETVEDMPSFPGGDSEMKKY